MDEYVEESSQGWFSRLGKAFTGVLIGLALFVAAWPVHFWNEGRTVKQVFGINDMAKNHVTVSDIGSVDPGLEGQLVTMTGTTATDEVLRDGRFGVEAQAIRLRRKVEMFQWQEHKKTKKRKKTGGSTKRTTTYRYEKDWYDHAINSSNFKKDGYDNPDSMPFQNEYYDAAAVGLGAYQLSPEMVGKIGNFSSLPVDPNNSDLVEGARYHGGGMYLGRNPDAPEVGDVRVTFSVVEPGPVSVMAKQVGASFAEWPTKKKVMGQELFEGTFSGEQIIQKMRDREKVVVWLFRAGGFLMMFIGLRMVLKPLQVFADVLPFVGNIIGVGTGIVAFLIAAPCTMIAIAIGWISARPVLGIGLLVGAVACFVLLFRMRRKKEAPPELPTSA